MAIAVKTIGVVCILVGVLIMARPEMLRRLTGFFGQGKRMYLAGVLRIGLAVVFLLGARECDESRVIAALGILLLVSGLTIFMLGATRLRGMLGWFERQPLLVLRGAGLLVLGFGAVVIYFA